MKSRTIDFKILYLTVLFVLLRFCTGQQHCSPHCTYSLDPGTNKYMKRCTGMLPNQCQECDTRFYYKQPISGNCDFHETNIFNSSINATINIWRTTNTNINNYDGGSWIQLRSNGYISLENQIQPVGGSTYRPVAVYGIRCRTLFSIPGPNFDPTVQYRVNNIYSQNIQLVPNTNSFYPSSLRQWIYTTPFIPFNGQTFQINIQRMDSLGNTGGKDFLIKDSYCLIAHCVKFCISCTSLQDCSACQPGYFLDFSNHNCVIDCPLGQFDNTATGLCQLCDPKCDICTTTATTCTNCVDFGPFQSFLDGTTCYLNCPAPKIQSHQTHTCICPVYGYTVVTNVCTPCILNCLNCTATNLNICYLCQKFYYLVVGNTSCVQVCPAGQYGLMVNQLAMCFACDLTVCVECIHTATTCTKCSSLVPNVRYLFNYSCLAICPDGYEGNNSTSQCDLCMLGTYSYQNVCYTQCPQYYLQRHDIRACVLPGGYPLNLTVEVDSADTLKFTVRFVLGLDAGNLTSLLSSWNNIITLHFITESQHKLVLNSARLLQNYFQMMISNAVISNNTLVMYSSSVRPQDLIYTHSFRIRFIDNLFSPKNVIYSITAQNSTDLFPWVIRQYYQLNLKPLFLVGIFLAALGLIIILMRTKYVYRIIMEYIHCIQLLGLTFYALYPHAVQLNLYSFVMGLDFANFSFIINLTAKFIPPCYNCKSLVSYAFVIGDMNWIRLTGSLLLCFVVMLLICLVLYLLKCSRMHSPFYLKLVMDLVMIKAIHSWFSSLLYSGLNYTYNTADYDLYILSMHMLSYFLLGPVLYSRLKSIYVNKYPNLSFFFLIIFIILMCLLSLGPTLICALLMLITAVQWTLIFGFNIGEQQKPEVASKNQNQNEQNISSNSAKKETKVQQGQAAETQERKPLCLRYHNHLLRCMRPVTAFLIACIIMIHDQIVPIILVSVVLFILYILIIVDIYFLYEHYDELQKKLASKPAPKTNSIMNETKQDLKIQQRQTQYKDNQIDKQLKIFDEDDIDDGIVANKFRKNKPKNVINPFMNSSGHGRQSILIKNYE